MSSALFIPLVREQVSAEFLSRALSEVGLLQNQTILKIDSRKKGPDTFIEKCIRPL